MFQGMSVLRDGCLGGWEFHNSFNGSKGKRHISVIYFLVTQHIKNLKKGWGRNKKSFIIIIYFTSLLFIFYFLHLIIPVKLEGDPLTLRKIHLI